MPMRYSPAFRALMIQKMTDPDGPSPISLADEIGVSRNSLYRWVSEADTLDIPVSTEPPSFAESMKRLSNMKRPQDWSADDADETGKRLVLYQGGEKGTRILHNCRPELDFQVIQGK